MNQVLLTGRVNAVIDVTGQPALLLVTCEAAPQRILIRVTTVDAPVVGAMVEILGRLVDEPIMLDAKIVHRRDGRELRHAVVVASSVSVLPMPATAAAQVGASSDCMHARASVESDDRDRKEVNAHGSFPELPWQ
jgi:hypothetical protein